MTEQRNNLPHLGEVLTEIAELDLHASMIANHSGLRVLDELQKRGLTDDNINTMRREMTNGLAMIIAEAQRRGQPVPELVPVTHRSGGTMH